MLSLAKTDESFGIHESHRSLACPAPAVFNFFDFQPVRKSLEKTSNKQPPQKGTAVPQLAENSIVQSRRRPVPHKATRYGTSFHAQYAMSSCHFLCLAAVSDSHAISLHMFVRSERIEEHIVKALLTALCGHAPRHCAAIQSLSASKNSCSPVLPRQKYSHSQTGPIQRVFWTNRKTSGRFHPRGTPNAIPLYASRMILSYSLSCSRFAQTLRTADNGHLWNIQGHVSPPTEHQPVIHKKPQENNKKTPFRTPILSPNCFSTHCSMMKASSLSGACYGHNEYPHTPTSRAPDTSPILVDCITRISTEANPVGNICEPPVTTAHRLAQCTESGLLLSNELFLWPAPSVNADSSRSERAAPCSSLKNSHCRSNVCQLDKVECVSTSLASSPEAPAMRHVLNIDCMFSLSRAIPQLC